MDPIFLLPVAVGIATAGTWLSRRLAKHARARGRFLPHAAPGHWYIAYAKDWREAHPDAGQGQPGTWFLDEHGHDAWGSNSLDWDRAWLREKGMALPRLHWEVEIDRDHDHNCP